MSRAGESEKGANAMQDPFEALKQILGTGRARVGIIGLGYVGLPLARAFGDAGWRVLGFDIDAAKVRMLSEGQSYIAHLPADIIRVMHEKGFEATDDFLRLAEVDAILICVPTPLTHTRDPDLTYVVKSSQAVAATLRRGQLVVLESTTYPGTTRDVVLPILESSGQLVGRDFFLAFSPEREDPGNAQYSTANIPKVVGGMDPASLDLAAQLYGRVVARVVCVSSTEVAEACKILENTYRAVNIALVNELKVLFDRMKINVWEVIDAAKTKPFGYQAFYPGPGVGGHCIPVNPFYLTWIARKFGLATRFIELAGEVNNQMLAYVVEKITEALNERTRPVKGTRVTLLGIAYKKDLNDARESPALEILTLLQEKGALVEYNDPFIPQLLGFRRFPNLHLKSQPLTPEYLMQCDCIVVLTDHSCYDWQWIYDHARLIVDTRNALHAVADPMHRIVRA